jgi:hypothetical protein
MKTKKQVIEDNPEYKILINAVISRIGLKSVKDVNDNGISGGFNGFIYYVDTYKFAMKYRKYILQLLEYTSESLGEEIVQMVKQFGVFKGKMDKDELWNLYRYLGEGKCESDAVTNVLAWFAAEVVCQMFEE